MVTQNKQNETKLGVWFQARCVLLHTGFDMGKRREPSPLDVVKIARRGTVAPNQPSATDVIPSLPSNIQTISPVEIEPSRCFCCTHRGHWAKHRSEPPDLAMKGDVKRTLGTIDNVKEGFETNLSHHSRNKSRYRKKLTTHLVE